MPFSQNLLNVSIFPHIFSRVSLDSKNIYRNKYKKIKKYSSLTCISSICVSDGIDLAKDIMSSKLKAYGYKSLFAIVSGPVIQFIALPFYVLTVGSKYRRFAVAFSEVGAKISSGQMGIVNWCWIGADLILFGEPVSITDEIDLMFLKNETIGEISKLCEDMGGLDQ